MSLDEASKFTLRRSKDRYRRDVDFIHLRVSQDTTVQEFDHRLACQLERENEEVVQIDPAQQTVVPMHAPSCLLRWLMSS